MWVCVAAVEQIDIHIDIFTKHLLTAWVWNDWVNFFSNDDNDSDFEGF